MVHTYRSLVQTAITLQNRYPRFTLFTTPAQLSHINTMPIPLDTTHVSSPLHPTTLSPNKLFKMVGSLLSAALLAVTASAATIVPKAETSVNTMPQMSQTLTYGEEDATCPKHDTSFTIINKCPYPVHIWRADSSIDKAAELASQATFKEPLRQDWRSGILSYRLATDAGAPYKVAQPVYVISYQLTRDRKKGIVVAEGKPFFGNPFKGYPIEAMASAGVDCREKNADGPKKAANEISMAAGVFCETDITKSHLGIGAILCAGKNDEEDTDEDPEQLRTRYL